MQLTTLTGLLAASSCAFAFPAMERDFLLKAREAAPKEKRQGFSPSQRIDVSGEHAFVAPGSGDLRGPCPGLNALANHNYLPHNGIATIQEFITQCNQVYGMGIDLATFLAVYGAVIDGNGLDWSIGGATNDGLLNGLLTQPQGLIGSHNKYESDASPTRGDLYLKGNNYLLQMDQFNDLYSRQSGADANYNLDVLTKFRSDRFDNSVQQNPYFFNGPFTGVAVQPAAYTFIYRFMANKSEEHPEGVLNQDVLKSFFAITGDEGDFTYTPGYERIPENWYTRAAGDEYTIPYFQTDLVAAALEYPKFLNVGGNLGKPNSFVGVDINNLTGGVYNTNELTQNDNLECFAVEAAIAMTPDMLTGIVSNIAGAVSQLKSALGGGLQNCPQIPKFNEDLLTTYPGFAKINN